MKTLKKTLAVIMVVLTVLLSAPLNGFVGMDWDWISFGAKAAVSGNYTLNEGESISCFYNKYGLNCTLNQDPGRSTVTITGKTDDTLVEFIGNRTIIKNKNGSNTKYLQCREENGDIKLIPFGLSDDDELKDCDYEQESINDVLSGKETVSYSNFCVGDSFQLTVEKGTVNITITWPNMGDPEISYGKIYHDQTEPKIITFGAYPQTLVIDENLITNLEMASPAIENWSSYDYYISGKIINYMKYYDIEYNDDKYRGVYFEKYRPYTTRSSSGESYTSQDNNGYEEKETYWFKYEPLRWRVLDNSSGYIMCEDIVDSQAFQTQKYSFGNEFYSDPDGKNYANNWEFSTIREWLNNDFYNTAFTSIEKSFIVESVLDTPAYSETYSIYSVGNTIDNIYLPSFEDFCNIDYGFPSNSVSKKGLLTASGTDYAKIQGLSVGDSNGNSSYYTRTPGIDSQKVLYVTSSGFIKTNSGVSRTSTGVRPAMRLSIIDDDELNKINRKAHTIIVTDPGNGLSALSPIEGANVRVEETVNLIGEDLITDANGAVVTTDYGLRIVTVKANGYRDYAELYQISKQTARIIPLEKDKNDGLPYLTMCSAAKNNGQKVVDLRNQALNYTEGKSDLMLLWLKGNWGEHGEGYFRVYQESINGNPGKEFQVDVGSYLNIMAGRFFAPGVPVKVQMIAANGVKSEVVELNVEINRAPVVGGPTENTKVEEFTKVDWLGNFPIASDDEVFTKLLTNDMSVSSELIPVEFSIENNDDGTTTYKGTIGFVKGEGLKNIKNNESEENDFEWETLKDNVNKFKETSNPKEYWNKLKKEYEKKWQKTKLKSSIDTEVNCIGFIEITTDQNGKIINSEGGVILNGSASYVFGQTFFYGPVPLYYEFKPGIEAELSAGITFYNEENGLTFKLNFNGIDLAIPSISLEGGVGVRGVATAGLIGTGKLNFGLLQEDVPVNVDLSLDGSVHIKVLFVADYKWSFASTNIHFYPKSRATDYGFAMAMNEIDETELSITSRDYLNNTTSWIGSPISLMALSETPFSITTLQEGVMPDAMPQIHQINGKQIILFLRDVETRDTGNHTQLVYSIGDNGIWSEPVPVFESETADFFFNSAVCNGKLVVAWQKSKKSVQSLDVNELLTEVSSNSEIYVATFDSGSEKFTDVQSLTDNAVVDMMPVVSADAENTYISWVSNDANNVFGSGGNYHIYQATLNDDEINLLNSTTEYVTEIAAGEKDVLIATANADGSSNLHMISGDKAIKIADNINAAGLAWNKDIFTWQADGGLYGYSSQSGTIETIIEPTVALSSSYEYISNEACTSVVWTESSEEGYQVKASYLYDDKWSNPIILMSGQDDTVAFMDAQMLDDDSISLIMNAVSYTDDGEIELTSLQYANIIPRTNIAVALADPNYPDWEKQTQKVDVVLKNTGEYPINSVDLNIENAFETLLSDTLSITLLPGESTVISEEINIDNIDKLTELTVSASVDGDNDDSDNNQKIVVGKTDASLSVNTYIRDEEYLFVLTATNQSNTDANAAISIIEDSVNGVVLSMKNIGVIDNVDNIQYLYTIDRSKVDFADADTKTFFFSLSTLEDDWFKDDNICSFTMKKPTSIISDPNGQIDVIDIVEPVSVDIIEKTLHFDSVDSESMQLNVKVLPENTTNAKVFWKAEDDSIVHVNEDGVVTPLNIGTTTIIATVDDEIKDIIQVSVGNNKVAIDSINLNITSKTIQVGETFDLIATVNPSTQNEGYVWNIGDSSVVGIQGDANKITVEGLKVGSTIITVEGNDGMTSASCEVIVICNHSWSENQSKCKECGYDRTSNCSCKCHKSGLMGIVWKIIRFFYKLFKINPVCTCGVAHY